MVRILSNNTIIMTRGDSLRTIVTLCQSADGEVVPYIPMEGDVIRFALKHHAFNSTFTEFLDSEPLILKVISNDTLELVLDPEDTKDLGFGDYVYDIQITLADGTVDTFIDNAVFRLTPEVD